jgi:hypothetical protein
MPPHGAVNALVTANDINEIFSFDPPFFIGEVTAVPYTGQWVTPTEFQIKIVDEGYPVPFRAETMVGDQQQARATRLSGIKVGEWSATVNSNRGPCGGFDINGQRLSSNQYCLQDASGASLQSNSTPQALEGNYGLRLPNISNIIVRNVAVDDATLEENIDNKIIFDKTQVAILLQPTMSYEQLATYCERDGSDILNINALADSADLIVVGCANLLSNGSNADDVYSTNIDTMRRAFSEDGGGRRKREALEETSARVSRQASFGNPLLSSYPLPVASEVVLQFNSIINPRGDPASDPIGFVQMVQRSFSFATLAEVIFETTGVAITDLTMYSQTTTLPLDTSFYYEFDDDLTPQIVRVEAGDPDNEDTNYSNGDTVTIFFDRSTDQPPVGTKGELDRIFLFTPPLGNNYIGQWVSPSVLEITILDIGDPTMPKPSVNPVNFNLTFLPNIFHTGDVVTSNNTILPTETPWCVGVSVCGPRTFSGGDAQTIGICSANGLSCRAYQGWIDLAGSFGTGTGVPVSVFPWWWIVIAIVIVILIVVLVVVAYFIYRYYSRKAVRKEALRVIRRWKKDQFAPGKEVQKKDEPKPWEKPDDVSTMRGNPDPFDGSLRKLPVIQRPPTAMIEAEHLPPVPEQPFRPRAPPQIRPSVTSLQSITGPSIPKRLSTGSLPPSLVSGSTNHYQKGVHAFNSSCKVNSCYKASFRGGFVL